MLTMCLQGVSRRPPFNSASVGWVWALRTSALSKITPTHDSFLKTPFICSAKVTVTTSGRAEYPCSHASWYDWQTRTVGGGHWQTEKRSILQAMQMCRKKPKTNKYTPLKLFSPNMSGNVQTMEGLWSVQNIAEHSQGSSAKSPPPKKKNNSSSTYGTWWKDTSGKKNRELPRGTKVKADVVLSKAASPTASSWYSAAHFLSAGRPSSGRAQWRHFLPVAIQWEEGGGIIAFSKSAITVHRSVYQPPRHQNHVSFLWEGF